jgi:hypothetical protein
LRKQPPGPQGKELAQVLTPTALSPREERHVEDTTPRGDDDRPSHRRQCSGPERRRPKFWPERWCAGRGGAQSAARRASAYRPQHAQCAVHARLQHPARFDRSARRGFLPTGAVCRDLFDTVLRHPALRSAVRRLHGRQFPFVHVHTVVNNGAVDRSNRLGAASLVSGSNGGSRPRIGPPVVGRDDQGWPLPPAAP